MRSLPCCSILAVFGLSEIALPKDPGEIFKLIGGKCLISMLASVIELISDVGKSLPWHRCATYLVLFS